MENDRTGAWVEGLEAVGNRCGWAAEARVLESEAQPWPGSLPHMGTQLTCPADLSPPWSWHSNQQGCGSRSYSPSFGGPTFHHSSMVETVSTLHLMMHQTRWKITFQMNPFAFRVPCPLLFESMFFSAMTILYFVLKHTYLSCHCIHQWQGLYSFMYFSSTILFVFHTSVCLKAWGGSITIFLSFHPIFPM